MAKADASFGREKYEEALDLYKKALEIQPTNRDVLKRCATCCTYLKKWSGV